MSEHLARIVQRAGTHVRLRASGGGTRVHVNEPVPIVAATIPGLARWNWPIRPQLAYHMAGVDVAGMTKGTCWLSFRSSSKLYQPVTSFIVRPIWIECSTTDRCHRTQDAAITSSPALALHWPFLAGCEKERVALAYTLLTLSLESPSSFPSS